MEEVEGREEELLVVEVVFREKLGGVGFDEGREVVKIDLIGMVSISRAFREVFF